MLDDWFRPAEKISGVERPGAEQAEVDRLCQQLTLYHYESCMFCNRVKRAMLALKLNIELRDILTSAENRTALIEGGGKATVPCLRIAGEDGCETWLYESADIIEYLRSRFAA